MCLISLVTNTRKYTLHRKLGEIKLNEAFVTRGRKQGTTVKFSIERFKGTLDREADSRYQDACKEEEEEEEQKIPPHTHIHIFIFF